MFRARVVRDARAKLCASPPWFLASDPGPCPPLLLSSSPPPRRGPAGVPAGVLAGVPVSRRVSWPGPVGVPAGLPVFRRVSRRGLAGVPAGVPASSSSPCPRRSPGWCQGLRASRSETSACPQIFIRAISSCCSLFCSSLALTTSIESVINHS